MSVHLAQIKASTLFEHMKLQQVFRIVSLARRSVQQIAACHCLSLNTIMGGILARKKLIATKVQEDSKRNDVI